MELSERCIAQLEKENWPHIYEWQDAPGTVYSEHSHIGNVTLFITDGSIELTINKQIFILKTGDRFDVPPNTAHSAIVGSGGAQFVIGEEIDGDTVDFE